MSINNEENKRINLKNIFQDINCIIKDNAESCNAKSFKKESSCTQSLKKGDISFPIFKKSYIGHLPKVMQRSLDIRMAVPEKIWKNEAKVIDPSYRNNHDDGETKIPDPMK